MKDSQLKLPRTKNMIILLINDHEVLQNIKKYFETQSSSSNSFTKMKSKPIQKISEDLTDSMFILFVCLNISIFCELTNEKFKLVAFQTNI